MQSDHNIFIIFWLWEAYSIYITQGTEYIFQLLYSYEGDLKTIDKGDIVKVRAIVLDDNEIVRTVISDILEDRGYEVFNSSEPTFSPVYLDSKCPCSGDYLCANIVITDINMPNMSGLEFIEYQKSMGCKIQNIAVMSGKWTAKEHEHAERLGCYTFNKPFKIGEIKKWLDVCESKLNTNCKLSDLPVSRQ